MIDMVHLQQWIVYENILDPNEWRNDVRTMQHVWLTLPVWVWFQTQLVQFWLVVGWNRDRDSIQIWKTVIICELQPTFDD